MYTWSAREDGTDAINEIDTFSISFAVYYVTTLQKSGTVDESHINPMLGNDSCSPSYKFVLWSHFVQHMHEKSSTRYLVLSYWGMHPIRFAMLDLAANPPSLVFIALLVLGPGFAPDMTGIFFILPRCTRMLIGLTCETLPEATALVRWPLLGHTHHTRPRSLNKAWLFISSSIIT